MRSISLMWEPVPRGPRFHFMALLVLCLSGIDGALVAQSRVIPDSPQRRWEFFYQQRAYPFDRVPAGAFQSARADAAAQAFLGPPPPIAGTQWQQIGPERIPIFSQSTGRLSTIAVDPSNPSILYIGGAQGGVWGSTDGGGSWTPLTDNECSLAMGSIAIDPATPNIIYAGTGEQHFSGDSYYGCGVLRSDDGGVSWTTLGSAVFQSSTGGASISRVVIDPNTAGTTNATRILVASDFGLFRSTNSGNTWTEVLNGTATDLVQDPLDPANYYAAVYGQGVYRSINGGITWTSISTGLPASNIGRINLGMSPSTPSTVYASIHNTTTAGLSGIFRTVNSGSSWTSLPAAGASCSTQCWYDMALAVHPNGPDTVYFGGVDLYKSTDGGSTFAPVTNGIHVDQHALVFDPSDPTVLYAGNDGGVYRTTNGGTTWTTLNTNLALTQFYHGVSLHPTDPTGVLAGTQDNGTLYHNGTPDWGFVLGGDGGYTAIDSENPITQYAETQWSPGGGFSGPRRSDGIGFNLKVNGINTNDPGLFIPPLVMDPSDPHTLYFGTYRVYRTRNQGENWTVISPGFTGGSRVSAIAAADTNVIYVGSTAGQVFVSVDGGVQWLQSSSGLPARYVTDIAVNRSNPQIAYAVFSGFLTSHVFRTTNGGNTWQSIDGNLPDIPVNAMLIDPGNDNMLFIGTDLGAYATADGGVTWSPFNSGLPNVAVYDLVYQAETGTMVAATHGRGMFSLQMATPVYLDVAVTTRADTAFDGSTDLLADSVSIVVGGTGAATVGWTAAQGSGSWLTLTNASGSGSGTLSWTRDPTGLAIDTYVDTMTVSAPGAVGSPAIIIDSLVVMQFVSLSVTPESRADTVQAGSTVLLVDSAMVNFGGADPLNAVWTASHGAGNWLTMNTFGGTGPGPVYWTRDPTGLSAAVYIDTISVTSTGAVGSPGFVIDSLVVLEPLAVGLSRTSGRDSVFFADVESGIDSANVLPTGVGSGSAQWSATNSSTWLTVTTASGSGAAVLRWTVTPEGLSAGTYVDTITVTAVGAATNPAKYVHTLVVLTVPITVDAAIAAFLSATGVSPSQQSYLDSRGNNDGVLNLGDLIALIDRLGPPAGSTSVADPKDSRASGSSPRGER